MNQSAASHQHRQDNNGPIKRSAAGQSLEYEELKYFDWGFSSEDNNIIPDEQERVFVSASASGTASSPAQPRQASAAVDEQCRDNDMDDDDDADPWSPIPFRGEGRGDSAAIFGFSRHNYMDGIRAWSAGNFLGGSSSPPAAPAVAPSPLPAAAKEDDCPPPGMVRSISGSLSSSSEGDETMSSDDDASEDSGAAEDRPPAKGVSFNEQVRVLPIPPIAAYTPEQRYRMYANRFELRENKVRAKKEYEFDNFDWRNATEEHSMAICPLSGELLHPAHL
mmetsp:Transcript_1843/g.4048  ORF Transcript_1843/g.4048 Transcript_1843/m.4048 type:complete len:278 (-) Transcript_1843:194-1027(-)